MNDSILARDIADLARDYRSQWQRFDGKTIFMTGATGFICSFIVRLFATLAKEYHFDIKLILLVFTREEAEGRFGALIDELGIRLIPQDITAPLTIDGPVDYVIHAASKANPAAYMADPVGTITTNVIGTHNVMTALLGKQVTKILYLSTMEAYGQHGQGGAITEDMAGAMDAQNVRSCYPLSKSCSENLCFSYAAQHGLPAVVARLGYIFGPGDNINDPKVVTAFMNDVLQGRNIVLKSAGLQERTYCYIKDTVLGILLALLDGEPRQVYNIASASCLTTIKGIAQLVIELFGGEGQRLEQVVPDAAAAAQFSLIQNNILDNSKIRALGYEESTDIRQGLINTGLYFGLTPA